MSEQNIQYVSLLNGSMGIGHRPKLKKLSEFKDRGVTHIWTLLSEKEGALDIKKAAEKAGLEWLWLPLDNGKPPEDTLLTMIQENFKTSTELLSAGARLYLHCSAGIHRTGMISYAFLRSIGLSKNEAIEKLTKMRALTSEGVGEDRLAWGESNFGDISID